MHIAIDGAELEGRVTGVGRYLERLLLSWCGSGIEENISLLLGETPGVDLPGSLQQHRYGKGLIPWQPWRRNITLARAARKLNPDIFFAPAYVSPLSWRGPTVLTVHDLSYEEHPEWFPGLHGTRMRWMTRRSVQAAKAVIAVSTFTKNALIRRYDVDPDKIHVVYHGLDDTLLQAPFTARDELLTRYELQEPFVIMVGSLFERRFPMQVLKAMGHLQEDVHLVVVGDDRRRADDSFQDHIDAADNRTSVHWLQYVSQKDLLGLYRCADALLYLSAYEGFGLPPLEGMLFGLPAIVSNRGALQEVYAGSARMVQSETPGEIAAAIDAVCGDRSHHRQLVEAGSSLVRKLTLQACAGKTMDLLRSVAEESA